MVAPREAFPGCTPPPPGGIPKGKRGNEMGSVDIQSTIVMSETRAKALNILGAAVYACNSVESWALDSDGFPYHYARNALQAALEEMFGYDRAQAIRDVHVEINESVTSCIRAYFGHDGNHARLLVVECDCREGTCPREHRDAVEFTE